MSNAAVTAPQETERAQHDAFRRKRDQGVRAPQGPLALQTTAWVSEATEIEGVPGTWAPADTGDGLRVTADAAAEIIVDGATVDGDATIYSQTSMTPSSVRFDDRLTATVIGPDHHGRFALRVWDAEAAEERGFQGISSFDYDPAWHKQGTFEPVDGGVEFEYGKSQGGSMRRALSPGTIRFEHDGEQIEMVALPDGDSSLQIVFADATTGEETYDVGRFLYARPRHDGTVSLDFNRAIVPPCSMSDQFNCPLPPAGNRLTIAVRAGEQRPTFGG
ncbi:DUF1684 domain-containing protein [Agrococcus sp. Ld7]|uniref:DUF1684 domain-containing protein n=1 Tax=Agrococcus sp. Ld7 TaxID=649148 RepID=UPI00386AF5FA